MPVLFNMFKEWNEKSVVLHISFVSFVINYSLLNAGFDLYSVGLSWIMLSLVHTGRLYVLCRRFRRLYNLVAENGDCAYGRYKQWPFSAT